VEEEWKEVKLTKKGSSFDLFVLTKRMMKGRWRLLFDAIFCWVVALLEVKFVDGSRIAVIGAGYSGLSAACELRQLGHDVVVLEKNGFVGGRAHQFEGVGKNGARFIFDAGPSWYWMPEVFERFFERHGRAFSDFYVLKRLDPAYRLIFGKYRKLDVPGGSKQEFMDWAFELEKDHDENADFENLNFMMEEARQKYEKGINEWIWHPMVSLKEMIDPELARAAFQYDMFGSFVAHLRKFIRSPTLLTILKWPVIFLGTSPENTASMYSLMTYGGHALGTFYPEGGMAAPARAMAKLAEEMGVEFRLNHSVTEFVFENEKISGLCFKTKECTSERIDGVVASADYHFVEQNLLPRHLRRYDEIYWSEQVLSPLCVLFYLGFDRSIRGLEHHTFFFDVDLDAHLHAAFVEHQHTSKPTFYVSATSKSDTSVSSNHGGETLFILVPMSYQLNGTDTESFRESLLNTILSRMEQALEESLKPHLVYKQSYGSSEFEMDFHAFRGNAFGHANLLSQSLVLKPRMDSLVPNLVYAGHLTNPGPGVPPAIVSGAVAANLLHDNLNKNDDEHQFSTLVALFIGVHAIVIVYAKVISTRMKSYMACAKLLFEHGRTYFAAATLMNLERFFDTAAMYGLFRVADDFVDNVEDPMERQRNLESFIRDFWRCYESGAGEYELHPTLPAIIESSIRNQYPRDLFERFFKSMRMDVSVNVCETMDDTMEYMEGSAAVIGEFMMPILMPRASAEDRQKAMPHARDLGIAFQLTNMLRDIGEDLDLQRQYIPVQICNKYGVDLKKRDHEQEGFREMMEEMFEHTEKFYISADVGISMLPEDVNDVIRVARLAYHRIHHKIRAQDYDVFSGRAKVHFREKLGIVMSHISTLKIVRMATVELYVNFLHMVTRQPTLLVLFGCLMASLVSIPSCSYLRFHFIFIIPPMIVLLKDGFARSQTLKQSSHFWNLMKWAAVLCAVATLYTAPWDNFLVYAGVWDYPGNRVLFTVGYVPMEEYAFFSLETILCCAMWLACFPDTHALHLVKFGQEGGNGKKPYGMVLLLGLWFMSCRMTGHLHYMGLILIWSIPVLMLQWFYGAGILVMHRKALLKVVSSVTLYLCIVDSWAIRHGIWRINTRFTIQNASYLLPLPIEEAVFFLVTAMMCSWGLTLAAVVQKYQDDHLLNLNEALWKVYDWQNAKTIFTTSTRTFGKLHLNRREWVKLILMALVAQVHDLLLCGFFVLNLKGSFIHDGVIFGAAFSQPKQVIEMMRMFPQLVFLLLPVSRILFWAHMACFLLNCDFGDVENNIIVATKMALVHFLPFRISIAAVAAINHRLSKQNKSRLP